MIIDHLGLRARTGKSSLTVQFVDGHFVDSYYPTIENTFSKVIRYKNQDFAVEMIDTAGQVCERYNRAGCRDAGKGLGLTPTRMNTRS